MKNARCSLLKGLPVLAFLMTQLSTALADDTEIFFNIERDVAQPNILFILDNSGSMNGTVEVLSSDFDSSQSYNGDYNDGRVYYVDGNRFYSINADRIECSDIEGKLDSNGRTAPYRMAYFYNSAWRSLDRVDINQSRVDCQADGDVNTNWNNKEAHEYYSGNYLNWYYNYRQSTTKTRLQIVQEVAKNLADGVEGVNIGLMAFDTAGNQDEGGRILEPVSDVSSNRQSFKNAVDSLDHETWTPLAETLFGAKRYFEGAAPFLSAANRQASGSMEGGDYKSPIDLECQVNHVVLLTDGEPTQDTNHNSYITNELGIGSCSGPDNNCLPDVADYMYANDINSDFVGTQRVVTHTIGFQEDLPILATTAQKGGGKYYLADDADNLEQAFNAIVRDVLSTNTTFSSPGVSVNNFNQLNHLDSLYFSVFEPVVTPLWPGNLKKYRLTADGTIVDSRGADAIDPATGFFRETAKSYWSGQTDGAKASQGGAAGEIPDDNTARDVYTYYPGSTSTNLTSAVNEVSLANQANLGKALFGDAAMTDAEHSKLIRWSRGVDVNDDDGDGQNTDSRKFIADPLHSRPYLQVYGGTEQSPETTIFFGDNQGYLHAVDGESGDLHFSFIPSELLANQKVLMDNQVSEYDRPYGMDGSVVAWFFDEDNNREVGNNDHVYIYSGMRRGGRSYYALDVTDPDSPSVLWTIHGGTGDFGELGQSWSDPVKHRVRLDDQIKEVLFFTGGYDEQQDDVAVRTEDTMGRAIYMVDAETGDRLWWASIDEDADLELSDMKYSIPATPVVLDVNGDGLADQLYVGDMGGQIWRVDFQQGNEAASFASGGVIADLAGDTEATNRRFYHSPDLSGTLKGGQRYLNIAIGSGYQAHPLDKAVDDRFYKLTVAPVAIPRNEDGDIEYTKVTESDLYDVTDNLIQQGTDEEQEAAEDGLSAAKGWYIRLTRDGEKVLASSTTLRGDVYFTTFEPSASLDPCVPAAGQSRLFHVELRDGRAVVNYDGIGTDDALTAPDRERALKTLGLPPSPGVIVIDGNEIIAAGTETLLPPAPDSHVQKIYWYEE